MPDDPKVPTLEELQRELTLWRAGFRPDPETLDYLSFKAQRAGAESFETWFAEAAKTPEISRYLAPLVPPAPEAPPVPQKAPAAPAADPAPEAGGPKAPPAPVPPAPPPDPQIPVPLPPPPVRTGLTRDQVLKLSPPELKAYQAKHPEFNLLEALLSSE